MVDEGIPWIYLVFFLIPLARILPRLVRKLRGIEESSFGDQPSTRDEPKIGQRLESVEKPQTKESRVLGELNQGVKDFNKIQKNLGINNQELENILKGLEEQGLMKVVERKGVVGNKVELYPTDKGFKKYYS